VDLPGFIDGIASFAENHTAIVIALVLCLLFFVYRKPKLFFTLLLFGLFLVGLFYIITNLVGSGSNRKKGSYMKRKNNPGVLPNRFSGISCNSW